MAKVVDTSRAGDGLSHLIDLSDAGVTLNLSKDRWNLNEEASVSIGVDVTSRGKLRPDRGRKPVKTTNPPGGITSVIPVDAVGRTAGYFSDRFEEATPNYRAPSNNVNYHFSSAGYNAASETIDVSTIVHADYIKTATAGPERQRTSDRVVVYRATANGSSDSRPADQSEFFPLIWDVVRSDSTSGIIVKGPPETIGACYGYVERHRGYFGHNFAAYVDKDGNTLSSLGQGNLTKSTYEYDATGPWPNDMVGGIININGDKRYGSTTADIGSSRTIIGLYSAFNINDTLLYADGASNRVDWAHDYKFTITYSKSFDMRGVFVTNGRKFWLLRDGVYALYMDLGDDALIGQKWSGVRISNSHFIFSNSGQPCRVLRLDAEPLGDGETSGDETIAGCLPPIKGDREASTTTDPSWVMTAIASQGSLEASKVHKVKVRAVNLVDSLESTFVDVLHNDDLDNATPVADKTITVAASDAISVFTNAFVDLNDGLGEVGNEAPPQHKRWSHIEVWRTQGGRDDYFLESRITIATQTGRGNENPEEINTANKSHLVGKTLTATGNYPGELAETALSRQPLLTANDSAAGGLPPVCQAVTSLLNVTICGGKADTTIDKITAWSRQMFNDASGATYTASTNVVLGVGTNYNYREGDYVEVYDPGAAPKTGTELDLAGAETGQFKATGTSGSSWTLKGTESLGPTNLNYTRACLNRSYVFDPPTIERDEDIWYSRTDKFSPESFPVRVLQLSNIGDTFRAFSRVGNYVAVIMDRGVHLLYLTTGATLALDTVASDGEGTPWPKSVITVGRNVVWATPRGPSIMATTSSPNNQGHRGVISSPDESGAMSEWFSEAFENGWEIDAGLDSNKDCIRFRRKEDDNTYRVAQFNIKQGRWTTLEDDAGLFYVRSPHLDPDTNGTRTYSIGQEGGVFEVNAGGEEWPYGDATVQDEVANGYAFGETRLFKVGAFDEAMLGDVVRLYIDGEWKSRVIRTASADQITFDVAPGLSDDTLFTIGAVHFRLRWAQLLGNGRVSGKRTVKTLEGLTVRALPGPRGDATSLTLRAYENFSDKSIGGDAAVGVLADDAGDLVTSDRSISLNAQGHAIEIEMESTDARNDFAVAAVLAEVREDTDPIDDADAGEN